MLLIIVDDLRNELGCYGHPTVLSPNIDRLANQGMRFDRAYVQMTFCNPSRSSFLSGLRPARTGVFDNRTFFRTKMPKVVTLPETFRRAGYRTGGFGKIFHGHNPSDDAVMWDTAGYGQMTPAGRQGEGRNLTGGVVRWCSWRAAEGGDAAQPDGQIARMAIDFLDKRTDKPFFLAVGFHKPHDPFVAPKEYFEPYPLEKTRLPREPDDRSPLNPLAIASPWKASFDRFTDRERAEFLRAYHACITFADAQIGKVLDALRRRQLEENTVVVLIGDHGYHLGEHEWWNKSTLYELSTRAPLMVYAPGMKAPGKDCSRLVEFVDLYPTLADLCGIDPPKGLQGRSFAPLLNDPALPWKQAAYSQLRRGDVPGHTVRTDRWRYVRWDFGRRGAELYDHQSDPGKYRNLVEDERYAEVRARLEGLLERQFGKPRP